MAEVGSRKEAANDRTWVWPEAVGQGVIAQTRTLRLAIRAPDNGHSFSAIFPVSPFPKTHFGKEQSGTDFGKEAALDGSRREHPGDCPRYAFVCGNVDRRILRSAISYGVALRTFGGVISQAWSLRAAAVSAPYSAVRESLSQGRGRLDEGCQSSNCRSHSAWLFLRGCQPIRQPKSGARYA